MAADGAGALVQETNKQAAAAVTIATANRRIIRPSYWCVTWRNDRLTYHHATPGAHRPAHPEDIMLTILLLTISNVFMTFAWYGHLKNLQRWPLALVILISWGIAFFEYCFQVPANRIGARAGFSLWQLKTIQEVITLIVFSVFAVLYMGVPIKWNHVLGFILIAGGAALVFKPWQMTRP
jgi:uncharacterized protein (DUF486 family)